MAAIRGEIEGDCCVSRRARQRDGSLGGNLRHYVAHKALARHYVAPAQGRLGGALVEQTNSDATIKSVETKHIVLLFACLL